MARDAVVRLLRRFVASTEPDLVRDDHAVPRGYESGNHLSIQVRPGRLSVQEHHRRTVAWSFVEIVHAKDSAFEIVDVDVMWRERIRVEVREAIVGRADEFHRGLLRGRCALGATADHHGSY